jgi:hypothetical protein
MKTLLRTLLFLALTVWLGAEVFFIVVAGITFRTLAPDTHTPGLIVGQLLRILHAMGLVSGFVALAVLVAMPSWGIFKKSAVLPPMALLTVMIALTAYSQLSVIPAMEQDRIACGGAIDHADAAAPCRVDFERLHGRSVHVEGAILLLGLLTVVFVARAETIRDEIHSRVIFRA